MLKGSRLPLSRNLLNRWLVRAVSWRAEQGKSYIRDAVFINFTVLACSWQKKALLCLTSVQNMEIGEYKFMFLNRKILNGLGVSGIAIVLGACATVSRDGRDPYAAANYTGASQLYGADRVAAFQARPQRNENGELLTGVSYQGIEGAREAHKRLAAQNAEQVDGNCEQFVQIVAGETLVDVSRLCDVPLADLVDFNPSIESPYVVEEGKIVQLPFATENNGTIFGVSGDVADLYTVQSGDTLDQIAYRYDVSTSSIANLNPYVTWSDVRSGDKLRLPTAARAETTVEPVTNVAAKWEGYHGRTFVDTYDGNGAGVESSVTALMPYNLGPANALAVVSAYNPEPKLSVNKSVTRVGGAITVTATGLPADSDVTFYRGDNVQTLKKYKTIRTDQNGVASISSIASKTKSSAGGIIFKAEPEDGKPVYSKRIGILNLKDTE